VVLWKQYFDVCHPNSASNGTIQADITSIYQLAYHYEYVKRDDAMRTYRKKGRLQTGHDMIYVRTSTSGTERNDDYAQPII
jgi:hypothetical protein